MDECSRCGVAILETDPAHVHDDKIFCGPCLGKVKDRDMAADAPAGYSRATDSLVRPPVPTPTYGALRMVAGLLSVTGILEMIGAVILGAILLTQGGEEQRIPAPTLAIVIASGLLSGLVILGIGQLLECVRDMAINSFHIRSQTLAAIR